MQILFVYLPDFDNVADRTYRRRVTTQQRGGMV